jgi:predicted DNA-binding transcriptional regulator AlpA
MSASTKNAELSLPGQMDLFGGAAPKESTKEGAASQLVEPSRLEAANDQAPPARTVNPKSRFRTGRPIKIETVPTPPDPRPDPAIWAPREEWWTSKMVCAFLKISRKTLWERRRTEGLGFPQPVQMGGARNLYRASAVRTWAEGMANAEY